MSFLHPRKHKIELSDYHYAYDIENRLFLAQLTPFEVDVLREIIDGSLKFSLKQLAEDLGSDERKVGPVLEKLARSKLFVELYSDNYAVDKTKRKYFEAQLAKFDVNFEPGMEFLQSLLNHVPIHVLPMWYAIPKTSDHIFTSIIEKYLLTPKIYEKYLAELTFEDPVLQAISADVFGSPDYRVSGQILMAKYNLSHEQFEMKMLLLEYHLVCCLSYRLIEGKWQEVVSPFAEWREYLCFRQENHPQRLEEADIQRLHPHDFGFIKDLENLLARLQKSPISLGSAKLSLKDPPHLSAVRLTNLIDKSLQLQLITLNDDQLYLQPYAHEWLRLSIQDQALAIYRQSLPKDNHWTFTDRDVREIERSLKRVMSSGWIYYDDFLKGFTAEIGRAEAVTLKSKGKRWKYAIPSYLPHEIALVEKILFGKLFEAGLVAIGTHQSRPCFCVTPFGRVALE